MAFPNFLQLQPCFLSILLLAPLALSQTVNISFGSSLTASTESTSSWKSPSGDFAFGFYQIENQPLFLLAIWFDKIPSKTTVWYANGDNPVPQGSKLDLTLNGGLTLSDPNGTTIWNAASTLDGTAKGDSYAAMLDTGNFVLVNKDFGVIWESFKDPTDTILPTQVLEVGGKLSCRQTVTNYSKGRFQLRMLDGNLVLNTISQPKENPYATYFVSNTLDANNSMNSGYRVVFNESGIIYIVRRNGNMVSLTSRQRFSPSSKDYYYRATLDFDGVFAEYVHPKTQNSSGSFNQSSWSTVWYIPEDICANMSVFDNQDRDTGPGSCGFNSYCTIGSNGRPSCECLPGFQLSEPNNKFNGCVQDRIPKCGFRGSKPEDLYDMHVLSNTFWPRSANFDGQQSSEDDCRESCLSDCDCVLAVLREGFCSKKKVPVSNGIVDRGINGKAFIKVAKPNATFGDPALPRQNKGPSTLVMVGSFLLGGSVFVNFLFISKLGFRRKPGSGISSSTFESNANLRAFTYKDLTEATSGFKEELGKGAFGTVYKGLLPPSSSSSSTSKNLIAVKKLDSLMEEGEKEFKTEVDAIANIHHRNLVRLLGFCDEGPNKLLVYEFMSNGTLASFLCKNPKQDWKKRTQIAFEIARGLVYLHEECSSPIIHCDIKPQNILLDDCFNARISDFGLAKLMMSDQTRTITTIRGTKGYVAPEWFKNMPITTKVDVYSYGVMLMEIVCCRRSVETEREEEEMILTDWVYDCYKEGRLEKLVENDEEARKDESLVERLVTVAIWCIHEDPSLRPSMWKVVQMLEGVVPVCMPPCPTSLSSFC